MKRPPKTIQKETKEGKVMTLKTHMAFPTDISQVLQPDIGPIGCVISQILVKIEVAHVFSNRENTHNKYGSETEFPDQQR